MNMRKSLFRFLLAVFFLTVFVPFDFLAHAGDAPESNGPHPPPRTAIPHAKTPRQPIRPNSPHGPSAGAQPFMKKLEGYNKRLREDPEDMEALVFLANANFDIQRFKNAEALYLRVLKIDPNNLHIRTDLASVYRNMDDTDKAVETLQVVLSLNPNHEVALYNIGIILLNDKEDFEGAADAWERLVQINPNDPLAEALKEKVKQIRSGKLKPEKPKISPPSH